MFKLSVAFFGSALIVCVLTAFISDVVNEFHFTKAENGSEEFNFEYTLDNGNTFHGQTFRLHGTTILLMFGENDVLYWTRDEGVEKTSFTQGVRIAERGNDTIFFKDDFVESLLTISSQIITDLSYATEWDLLNTCFRRNDNQTFDFEIKSKNNSRKYNGTTYSIVNDPFIQRFNLTDLPQRLSVFGIEFSDEELNSNTTFCRGPTTTFSESLSLSPGLGEVYLSPTLLKSLVG